MTFPKVSCVFLAILGSIAGPPWLLHWQNDQKLQESERIAKLFSNDLRPSLEQFHGECNKDHNAIRFYGQYKMAFGITREKSRQMFS